MKNSIKTLLKTSVALGAIVLGGTSWAASVVGEDGTNYGVTGRDMSGTVSLDNAAATAAAAGNFTTSASTKVHLLHGADQDYTGLWTLGKGTDVYFYLTAGAELDLSAAAAFSSSSGLSRLILDTVAAAGTDNLKLDSATQAQFTLFVNSTGTIDLPAAGELSIPVEVAENQVATLATATSVTGKLSGKGGVTLTGTTPRIESDLSKLSGVLTVPTGTTFFTQLSKFPGTLSTSTALDLSAVATNLYLSTPQNLQITGGVSVTVEGGKMDSVAATATAASLVTTEDLTVEELDVSALASTNTFALSPAPGKKLTVKKLSEGIQAGVIIQNGGGGTLVLPKLTDFAGDIRRTGTGTITIK